MPYLPRPLQRLYWQWRFNREVDRWLRTIALRKVNGREFILRDVPDRVLAFIATGVCLAAREDDCSRVMHHLHSDVMAEVNLRNMLMQRGNYQVIDWK